MPSALNGSGRRLHSVAVANVPDALEAVLRRADALLNRLEAVRSQP